MIREILLFQSHSVAIFILCLKKFALRKFSIKMSEKINFAKTYQFLQKNPNSAIFFQKKYFSRRILLHFITIWWNGNPCQKNLEYVKKLILIRKHENFEKTLYFLKNLTNSVAFYGKEYTVQKGRFTVGKCPIESKKLFFSAKKYSICSFKKRKLQLFERN